MKRVSGSDGNSTTTYKITVLILFGLLGFLVNVCPIYFKKATNRLFRLPGGGADPRHCYTYLQITCGSRCLCKVGVSEGFNIHESKTLGLRLVKILVEDQLQGTLKIISEGGTTLNMEFEAEKQ